MTAGTIATFDFDADDESRPARRLASQIAPVAAALALSAVVGVSMLHSRHGAISPTFGASTPAPAAPIVRNPYGVLAAADFSTAASPLGSALLASTSAAATTRSLAADPYGPLASGGFAPDRAADPLAMALTRTSLGPIPALAPTTTAALESGPAVQAPPLVKPAAPQVAVAPLPPPRPAELIPRPAERALAQRGANPATPPADNRSFFEKLFSFGQPPASAPTATPVADAKPAPNAIVDATPRSAAPSVASNAATAALAVSVNGVDQYTAV